MFEPQSLPISTDSISGFVVLGLFSVGVPLFAVGRMFGDSVSTIAGTVAMILSTIGSALILLREKNKISHLSIANKRQELASRRRQSELELAGKIGNTAAMRAEITALREEIRSMSSSSAKMIETIRQKKVEIDSLHQEVKRLNAIIDANVPKKD